MARVLTHNEIGQRIATLRKLKGFSQEELANCINVSRPSLAQIELGNRGLDVLELQQLSHVLGFTFDELLALEFEANQVQYFEEEQVGEYKRERMSRPTLQINKFKNVLLYILQRCAGNPNVNESVLVTLMYFADFNCYELFEEQLTGSNYRKLPIGPVPKMLDKIISQMIDNNQLQRVKALYHGVTQIRYLPLIQADLTQLKASEKDVIDKVVLQMADWSANAILDYVVKDMPYMISKEGEEINYELVFYREAPFSVRNYESEI